MADVVFLLIVVAFFGLMVLLVRFCDLVIGPDDVATPPESDARSGSGSDAGTVGAGSDPVSEGVS